MRVRVGSLLAAVISLGLVGVHAISAESAPPQRLPSAVLIYPLVVSEGGGAVRDTRIELVNLTGRATNVSCFYVDGEACFEIGFFVSLTANQPVSWLASEGLSNYAAHFSVPPFNGSGELKCVVEPNEPAVHAHNAIQGRAIVFGSDGQTLGYGAVGFQRISDGEFSGAVELDGSMYARCPDEMHFAFVASKAESDSEIVLAPCTEDLENQVGGSATVQFTVYNEFEDQLSASVTVDCYSRRSLYKIGNVFRRDTLGTETGHAVVRGVQMPVLAMIIDRFTSNSTAVAAANEPALRGGRAAGIRFP